MPGPDGDGSAAGGLGRVPLDHVADPSALAPRERLAVEYTRAVMADSNHVPDALMARIHEAFTDPELVELTFLVGFINMLNLFNNALGVRYHGEYALLASAAPA